MEEQHPKHTRNCILGFSNIIQVSAYITALEVENSLA